MNKILEESRFELLEELEVINMASQRETFRQKKMIQLNQVQRQLTALERERNEVQRREEQQALFKLKRRKMHEKLVARTLAKKMVQTVNLASLNFMDDKSLFFDMKNLKFYQDLLPQMYEGVFIKNAEFWYLSQSLHQIQEECRKSVVDKHMD